MNIRTIYKLDDLTDNMYAMPSWCNHDAWWLLIGGTIDCQNFNYEDAIHDQRIRIHLKARVEMENAHSHYDTPLEYVAVTFDDIYVGLVIGVDRNFGWDAEDIYITNYPKFQSMIAYAQAMYQNKPDNIIGETTKLDNLDGRFGYVIDKRFKTNLRKENA